MVTNLYSVYVSVEMFLNIYFTGFFSFYMFLYMYTIVSKQTFKNIVVIMHHFGNFCEKVTFLTIWKNSQVITRVQNEVRKCIYYLFGIIICMEVPKTARTVP